jgi:hypothetical protein
MGKMRSPQQNVEAEYYCASTGNVNGENLFREGTLKKTIGKDYDP